MTHHKRGQGPQCKAPHEWVDDIADTTRDPCEAKQLDGIFVPPIGTLVVHVLFLYVSFLEMER